MDFKAGDSNSATISDLGNGSYIVKFRLASLRDYRMFVTLEGKAVAGSPFRIAATNKPRDGLVAAAIGTTCGGKTALQSKLKTGHMGSEIPTIGPGAEDIVVNEQVCIRFRVLSSNMWMLQQCDAWNRYMEAWRPNGIIFMVNAHDRDTIDDKNGYEKSGKSHSFFSCSCVFAAMFYLHKTMAAPKLQDTPVLVFANHQDRPNCMKPEEVAERLKLKELKQKWFILGSSVVTGQGLDEGLDWLVNNCSGSFKFVLPAADRETEAAATE